MRSAGCITGIITEGACDASLDADICYGSEKTYSVAAVFHVRDYADDSLNGDFAVRYVFDAGPGFTYAQVARRYREYQLKDRGLGPSVDWDRVAQFKHYGGIRIEDDVVCTEGDPENLTREGFEAATQSSN